MSRVAKASSKRRAKTGENAVATRVRPPAAAPSKKPSASKMRAKRPPADLAETLEAPSLAVTKRALLDAGQRLISEKGFTRVNVEDIARAADVTTDMFYALFAGKGALLRALNDRFCDEMIAVTDTSTRGGIWRDMRAVEVVEVAVRSILDVVHDHAGLMRAFLSHGATDRALSAGLCRIGQHMTKRLHRVLEECKDPPPRGEKAVAFSMLIGVALAHHGILVGEEWCGVPMTREEVAAEAARAVAAYLGLPAQTVTAEGPAMQSGSGSSWPNAHS